MEHLISAPHKALALMWCRSSAGVVGLRLDPFRVLCTVTDPLLQSLPNRSGYVPALGWTRWRRGGPPFPPQIWQNVPSTWGEGVGREGDTATSPPPRGALDVTWYCIPNGIHRRGTARTTVIRHGCRSCVGDARTHPRASHRC
eukprot:gene22286-biopygen20727